MSETEEKEPSGGRANLIALAARPTTPTTGPVGFSRQELHQILDVYGRKVADGEWRDYAIDIEREQAVFSIFRRSSEVPLYRIIKEPRQARRQGMWSLVTATGLILRRGHDLTSVLRVIDRRIRIVA